MWWQKWRKVAPTTVFGDKPMIERVGNIEKSISMSDKIMRKKD